jgi:DNA-binding XRE family transcriptional regulator
MSAYNELYLDCAMRTLGEMFDHAANTLGYDGDSFLEMFVTTGIAAKFEQGVPQYVCGMSGFELADKIVDLSTGSPTNATPVNRFSRTPEYWAGWALGYYQWVSATSFSAIMRHLSFAAISQLYPTLHEADVSKFAEVAGVICRSAAGQTNLRRQRENISLSQSALAKRAGVSLRSIQMYEQRNKDINKAQAITLANLARALSCTMEDLLEPAYC